MTPARARRQSLCVTYRIAVATVGQTKVARSVKSALRNRYKLPATGCRARTPIPIAASLGSLVAVPETFIEGLEKIFGSVRDNRAWWKNCLGSSLHQCLVVLRGYNASDDDHDVISALSGQFRF